MRPRPPRSTLFPYTTLFRSYDGLLGRLRGIPGVANVGGINAFPLKGAGYSNGTFLELARPDEKIDFAQISALMRDPARAGRAEFRVATDGYFRAMGIRSCAADCSTSETPPGRRSTPRSS